MTNLKKHHYIRRRLFSLGRRYAVLTACLLLALCTGCSQPAEQLPQPGAKALAHPVLAEKDGMIWLVCGDRTMELGDMTALSPDREDSNPLVMMKSSDGGRVYYLANCNPDTGTGDLMTVDTRLWTKPAQVAEDVCAACVSANGAALYCKNVRDGAGELWLSVPGGKPELIAQPVVPDMFQFSQDGRMQYVVNANGEYALYVCAGNEARMLCKAEPPEFRNFLAMFDSKGGLLFSLGTSDEYRIYTDVDEETKQVTQGGEAMGLFGAADDFLYMNLENMDLHNVQAGMLLYYKAPGQEAVCLSEACAGVQLAGEFRRIEMSNCPRAFLVAEPAEDGVTEDIYFCTTGGEKTHIGQAELGSYMVLGSSLKTAAVMQQGGLYLFHSADGKWTGPEPLGTCHNFDSGGRILYWLDDDDTLNRCDPDTGATAKLLDKTMDFTLSGDEVYVCIDNKTVGRLDGNGVVTLVNTGGDMTDAGNGVYVSTFDDEIVYCPVGGKTSTTVLSGAKMTTCRGRFNYGAFTEETKAALQTLSEDALYYLDNMGLATYADLEVPKTPHGTLEEDLVLARSLWPGTMSKDAWQAAAMFCDGFTALTHSNGADEEMENAENLLGMAVSMWYDIHNG